MLEVYWAGWYKSGSSDKIWGIIQNGNTYYNFWCRRGARMQFKKNNDRKWSHKEKKGYKTITPEKLEEIYPGFMSEAEGQLVFGILSGKV